MNTIDKLELANELDDKIRKIKSFIFLAKDGGFWEELTVEKRLKLRVNARGYRDDDKEGLRLDKKITYKVIEVLEEEQDRLQTELDKLFIEESK